MDININIFFFNSVKFIVELVVHQATRMVMSYSTWQLHKIWCELFIFKKKYIRTVNSAYYSLTI